MANTQLIIPVRTRFGKLVTTSTTYQVHTSGRNRTYVDVHCDCGTDKRVRPDSLKSGLTVGCGCKRGTSRASEYRAKPTIPSDICARALCCEPLSYLSYTPKRTDSVVYGEWFCDHSCAKAEAAVRKQKVRRDLGLDIRTVKNSRLLKKYGITIEEWKVMLEAQNYQCKICGWPFGQAMGDKHTDHNHKTGKIRGILCSKCNTALGLFEDNVNIMASAIEYIHTDGNTM